MLDATKALFGIAFLIFIQIPAEEIMGSKCLVAFILVPSCILGYAVVSLHL